MSGGDTPWMRTVTGYFGYMSLLKQTVSENMAKITTYFEYTMAEHRTVIPQDIVTCAV